MSESKKIDTQDPIYTIGRISLANGKTEIFIGYLIELYLGENAGRPVLRELRDASSKERLLREIVENQEDDPAIKGAIINAIEVSDACRKNRNIVMHTGLVTVVDETGLTLERASKSLSYPTVAVRCSVGDLVGLANVYEKLWGRLSWILTYKGQQLGYQVLSGSTQISLPSDKLPRPPSLKDVDPDELDFRRWRLRELPKGEE